VLTRGIRGTAKGAGAPGREEMRQRAVAALAPPRRQWRIMKSGMPALSARSFKRREIVKS